jgi:UDP-N-acetylglucosamine--dolichyl-phosphate N-acetylglucosaminephosphotransferase
MPKHDPKTDLLHCSVARFKEKDLNILGRIIFKVFKMLKLTRWSQESDGTIVCTNFTIINYAIILTGPIKEDKLMRLLIIFQVMCTIVAFTIRYPMAYYFYNGK